MGLPDGEVTFCFTDVEGSTRLLRGLGEAAYEAVMERHREIIRAAIARAGGCEVNTEGDGFFVAFADPAAALAFAADAQRGLAAERWPPGAAVRVRMGLHRGPAWPTAGGDYFSLAVHQAARVAAAAHGGQVLVTSALGTPPPVPDGTAVRALGAFRLRDFDRPEPLAQLVGDGLPDSSARPRAAPAATGLPLPRTSFVGRELETRRLTELLDGAGLVTLVGVGGVGKSRLGLESAAVAAASFDRVHLAELASVAGDDAVLGAIALAVGAKEQPGTTLAEVVAAELADERALLVLDNCEHVADAVAPAVDGLLGAAPHLTVLATSQQPLRIPGEQVIRVEPLPTQGADGEAAPADADAVRLLLHRAAAAGATFGAEGEPSDAETGALVRIAHRLDGLPLALELAAARLADLGPRQLADALDERFSVLTSGFRTTLPRHRTLLGALQWSFDLLDETERTVLARLSAFSGRWTADDAAAVCSDETIGAAAVRAALASLVARSLVVVEPESDPAVYRLLESVRAFAAERLAERGEADESRRRHTAWVKAIAAFSQDAEDARWMPVVRRSLDDFRAVIDEGAGDPDDMLVMVARFAMYAETTGLWTEARERLVQTLDRFPGDWSARPVALSSLAQMLFLQGAVEEAERAALESLDTGAEAKQRAIALMVLGSLRSARGDPEGERLLRSALEVVGEVPSNLTCGILTHLAAALARRGALDEAARRFLELADVAGKIGRTLHRSQALANAAGIILRQGRVDDAEPLLLEARAAAEEVGSATVKAAIVSILGNIAKQRGDAAAARRYAEERLGIAERMGDRRATAVALLNLGDALALAGDHEEGARLAASAVDVFAALADAEGQALAGFNLALAHDRLGQAGQAAAALGAALRVADEAGVRHGVAHAVAGIAALAAQSYPEPAARLLGAAHRILEATGSRFDPEDLRWMDAHMDAARRALGDEDFGKAVEAGRGDEEACALAEDLLRSLETSKT